jgi:CDK-activating kinase assembly factor MAT1
MGSTPFSMTEHPAEESCPVCKSDHYLNPKMTMMVSACYHRICDSCVGRLFAHGSAPCPVCGTILKKSNFVVPVFEDMAVEKEVRIRKRMASIFNKHQEDFESLRAYNDYLEEVEEISKAFPMLYHLTSIISI